MWTLSALCVLLPLVAASPMCDDAIAQIFLSKTQLEGNLLDNFANKKFWFAASGEDLISNGNYQSAEITYGSLCDNTVEGTFVWRDAAGTLVETSSGQYALDGNRILVSGETALYFIKCSDNLFAAYRCQVKGDSPYSSKYYFWAAWDKTSADLKGELEICKNEIKKDDPSASFMDLLHP